MNPTVRCFVALDIPDQVRTPLDERLTDLREDGPTLRWTRPEGWHVTLAFLGDVPVGDLDQITTTLKQVLAGAPAEAVPTTLSLGDAGRYGRKVLWVQVQARPPDSLTLLATSIRAALRHYIEPDGREFRPHLTLARAARAPVTGEVVDRLQQVLAPSDDQGARTQGGPPPLARSWSPTAVGLWHAEHGRGPAVYTTMARWPLPGERRSF